PRCVGRRAPDRLTAVGGDRPTSGASGRPRQPHRTATFGGMFVKRARNPPPGTNSPRVLAGRAVSGSSAGDADEEILHGGVANAGAVVRVGPHVLRPSNAHSASILEFLRQLEARGFDGASSPVGLEPDGRERLRFVPGDVAIPPYPDWAQTDDA